MTSETLEIHHKEGDQVTFGNSIIDEMSPHRESEGFEARTKFYVSREGRFDRRLPSRLADFTPSSLQLLTLVADGLLFLLVHDLLGARNLCLVRIEVRHCRNTTPPYPAADG